MADSAENGSPGQPGAGDAAPPPPPTEHLNIKVTDNNNEVFFKIKRSTKLEKLMTAFCERQGKTPASVRFLFEGQRVQPSDTPDTVSTPRTLLAHTRGSYTTDSFFFLSLLVCFLFRLVYEGDIEIGIANACCPLPSSLRCKMEIP